MIFVRRAVTVPIALLLLLVLALTLLAHRANATVLSLDFYEEQIAAVGLFDAVHDEVLPAALDDFVTRQGEKLPDNLRGVDLPTDPESQAIVLDLVRTAVPPEYLKALTTAGIEALLAYLKGERDDVDWAVSIGEPVQSVFATSGRAPSKFEVAWTDLELTDRALQSLSTTLSVPELDAVQDEQARQALTLLRGDGVETDVAVDLSARLFENAPAGSEIPALATVAMSGGATIEQLAALEAAIIEAGVDPAEAQNFVALLAGTGAPPAESFALTILLGDERDAAVEWFEAQLFAASREFAAYLTGEQDTLNVVVDFGPFPELASVAAVPLNADADDLVRNGYQLTDATLQQELDAAEDPPFASFEEMRQIFTLAGRSFGIADLQRDAAGTDGLTVDQIRSVAGPAITWGVPAGATIVLLLAATIGMLGGRAWWSRTIWAALPIAGSATLVAIVAGPVFNATATPALDTALATTRADLLADDSPWTPLGLRGLDQLEATINSQAGALATNAVFVAALVLLVIGAATAWHAYARRRTTDLGNAGAQVSDLLPALSAEATEEQEKAA